MAVAKIAGSLVQKAVQVTNKNGTTFTRQQWVRDAAQATSKATTAAPKPRAMADAAPKGPSGLARQTAAITQVSRVPSAKIQQVRADARAKGFADQLKGALGNRDAFAATMAAMKADRGITKTDWTRIASMFVAPTAPSTSKAAAIKRIEQRQASLQTMQLKQAAMRGRSAA
jgi:hypothetical protein